MRESTIERYLHHRVEQAGGTTRKFKSPGRPHSTDRIVVWPDFHAARLMPAAIHFVECKAPGKRPRPGQVREHDRLRKLGCTVLVVDTKEKVDTYVERNKRI